MTESACTQLEHAKAQVVRFEHRLQQARSRMNAAHASGTPQARRDYADASKAASQYASSLQTAINKVLAAAAHCDDTGADAELLNEDIELASIAGQMALGGDEVVPFTDTEDFLVSESAAGGFGADFVYRAHLDPLTQMMVEAGYDIMDVSPEARLEAQLRELEEAGFLGDFGQETSLPTGRRALRRLRRRLQRQVRRVQRAIDALPHTGRGRRRRVATDPITRDIHAALRRRKRRVEARLQSVQAALRARPSRATASPRSARGTRARPRRRSQGRRGGKARPAL